MPVSRWMGLRESLAQAKAGVLAENHTPEKVTDQRCVCPEETLKTQTKKPVKLRLDADVVAALLVPGVDWQTCINETLHE